MPRIPVTSDIPIYLATSRAAAMRSGASRTLVIVPDARDWNDFGANLRASLSLIDANGTERSLRMRLLVEGRARTITYLTDMLVGEVGGNDLLQPIEGIHETFASVFESERDYGDFVAWLGFADAIGCLRRMHDAVLVQLEDEPEDAKIIELTQTLTFHQSALREECTWVAFRQGDRYLTPNRPPDVDDAAASFTVVANLRGMIGEHALDADFGNAFPLSRRALVLVGRNGTGKTRLFEAMIDGLRITPPWMGELDIDRAATFEPRPGFSRLIVFSSVASDPYPQTIPPWEGIDYRYFRMIGSRGGEGGGLTMSLVDCLRADGDTQCYDRSGAMHLLNMVLQPLGIAANLYVEFSDTRGTHHLPPRMTIDGRGFFPLFQRMNEQRNLQLYSQIRTDRPPIVVAEDGRVRSLSSGEVALLRFAAQAVASLRRGSIFLFDEPETHLHPNFISQFMEMLDRLLELSGSIALIATHSAYVVREVPARRVRMITRAPEDGRIMIDPPTMQTFGASIDTISQFVFGDIGPKHRFQHVLEEFIERNPDATFAQMRERFRQDLNPETLSYIAELIGRRGSL